MSSSKRAELAAKRARLYERNASPAAAAAASSALIAVEVEPPASESHAKFEEIIKDHLNCPICSHLIVDCITLPCSHLFCRYCISQWFEITKDANRKRTCALCKKVCNRVDLSGVKSIDRMIEDVALVTPESQSEFHARQEESRDNLKQLRERIAQEKSAKEDRDHKEAEEALKGSDSDGESSDESYGQHSSSSSDEEDDGEEEEEEMGEEKVRSTRRRVAVAVPAAAAAGTRRSKRKRS